MLRPKRAFVAVVISSIAIVALYITFGERVTRASLSHSVAAQVGQSFFGSCNGSGPGSVTCRLVPTDGSATGIVYAVESTGRCWHGARVQTGGLTGLPPSISGCIGLLDQIRTDDFIGSDTAKRPHGFF
jgi:hypothetical protein